MLDTIPVSPLRGGMTIDRHPGESATLSSSGIMGMGIGDHLNRVDPLVRGGTWDGAMIGIGIGTVAGGTKGEMTAGVLHPLADLLLPLVGGLHPLLPADNRPRPRLAGARGTRTLLLLGNGLHPSKTQRGGSGTIPRRAAELALRPAAPIPPHRPSEEAGVHLVHPRLAIQGVVPDPQLSLRLEGSRTTRPLPGRLGSGGTILPLPGRDGTVPLPLVKSGPRAIRGPLRRHRRGGGDTRPLRRGLARRRRRVGRTG